MRNLLIRGLASAVGLWLAAELLPGVAFEDTGSLVLAVLVFGVINAVVRPVAALLTLPLTILTLGLFIFVLNAAMIGLTAWLIPGFAVDGLVPALLAWIVVAVVGLIASAFLKEEER